jgi:lycopene cyclase domain-containing protein
VSYTALAVLGVAFAVVLDLLLLRTKLLSRRAFWVAYAIVLAFQLLTNGVLTGFHVVDYAPSAISGHRLAYAPVEDLAFGFSLVLQTLAWWVFWGRRARTARTQAGPATASRRPLPTETR